MTEELPSAPAVDSTPAPANDPTPSDIGRMLAGLRHAKATESAEPATEPTEIPAQAESAAPAEQPSGESTETADPAPEPTIEPPRSWTKEQKERWDSLPRETQEYLAQREQERDRSLRQSQNEAAEQRKAIQAELAKAEQMRKDYEARLPALMQSLHDASPFADVRSMADVEKMQAEDPFRFQQFQVYQWKMQAAQQELQQVEQRKAQEAQTKWASYTQEQDAKFAESLSKEDKPKITDLMKDAPAFLEDRGFTNQELTTLWNGNELFRDHRVQSLILDAMKYRSLQKAIPQPTPKPAPNVQRPGTAKPPGAAASETLNNLSAKLERSGSPKDLGALLGAMRRAKG